MKILEAVLEPPIQPIYLKIGPDWPNRQCCLAGSSQLAPRILIFSIAMGADYSFYVKIIETHACAFFKVIIFSLGSVFHVPINTLPLISMSQTSLRNI